MNTTKNMNDKRNITTGFFIVYFLKLQSSNSKYLKKNIIRQEDTKAGNIIKSSFIKKYYNFCTLYNI